LFLTQCGCSELESEDSTALASLHDLKKSLSEALGPLATMNIPQSPTLRPSLVIADALTQFRDWRVEFSDALRYAADTLQTALAAGRALTAALSVGQSLAGQLDGVTRVLLSGVEANRAEVAHQRSDRQTQRAREEYERLQQAERQANELEVCFRSPLLGEVCVAGLT
jgi:hypothetical protein